MTLVDIASTTASVASRLLQIQQIYYEPTILDYQRRIALDSRQLGSEVFSV